MVSIRKTTGIREKTEDIFSRKSFAAKIYNIIDSCGNDGLVISINAPWGEGKTSFLHDVFIPPFEGEGYTVVYFDAFKNDFFENPLTAITGEFFKSVDIKKEVKEEFKKSANKFLKMAGKVVIRYALKGDLPEVNESTESDIEGYIADFAGESIDNYLETTQGIEDFRKSLEAISSQSKKPLIFIIDELDRCRPDFALKILETIKHFFSVKNIVFILAINKIQISNYINKVYGTNDCENYLHKFIDLETDLPKIYPIEGKSDDTNAIFLNYLINKYIPSLNEKIYSSGYTMENIIDYFRDITKSLNLSLREYEKIFNFFSFFYHGNKGTFIYPEILIMLCVLRAVNTPLYIKMKKHSVSNKELIDYFKINKEDTILPHLYDFLDYTYNKDCSIEVKKEVESFLRIHGDNKGQKLINFCIEGLEIFG